MSLLQKINPFTWFLRNFWKLLLVFFVCLSFYLFYLDAQIQTRFSGNKWQVPAQIYSRPMHLSMRQEITRKEIVEELDLLGYRRVDQAQATGEYQVNGNSFVIMRRAFHFPLGYESEISIALLISQGKISKITNIQTNESIEEITLEPWLVTRLVSSDREDRMLVNLDEVPESLTQALVLVEDKDFYQHYGVAPLAILRALMANISAGRAVQGGSTLTQQLVKNLYLTSEKSLSRKVKEALMAVLIDARYSKQEILQAYLNEVFLGQSGDTGVHGFGLASYFYFDRPLNELNLPEVATLVGLIKGPSYYNPRRYPDRVIERRNIVLRVLFEHNKITPQQYEEFSSTDLAIGSGASLSKGKHPAYMDSVRRELRLLLRDPEKRQSGIKVFTTLDPNAQRKAELAVQQKVTEIETQRQLQNLQAAMVITDVNSGEVRALVGGKQVRYQGFNRALDARRSIGSLVKPAIYLTALEQSASYNLASPLQDKPIKLKSTYGKMWEPQNADKQFRGQVPLITALTGSLNVPTVSLGMELGLPTIIDSMRRLGINEKIASYPALTLGAVDLSPYQVNQMYQTIANNGRYITLHSVNAIVSSNNQLLWAFAEPEQQRFDEKAAYLVNYALHKVTLEGTAKAIKSHFPKVNMAGKTGTTDDYRDSWFSGFDKNILVTTWLGHDDNKTTGLTGSSGALKVFIDYQSRQEPKSLVRRFPGGLGIAHFDLQDGHLTQAGCESSISVPAILETLPSLARACEPTTLPQQKKKTLWERIFGG